MTTTRTEISQRLFDSVSHNLDVALEFSKKFEGESHQVLYEPIGDDYAVYYIDSTADTVEVHNEKSVDGIESYARTIAQNVFDEGGDYFIVFDEFNVIEN